MTDQEKPGPLVPAEVDLRHFKSMPLDVNRLLNSETWIEAADEPKVGHALMSLWCASWREVPCGSLPNNEVLIRRLAMCDRPDWTKYRDKILADFVLCSDGRLYHPVVAEKALEGWEKTTKNKFRTKPATDARRARVAGNGNRDEHRNDIADENRQEDRNGGSDGQRNEAQRELNRKEGIIEEDDDQSSEPRDELFSTEEIEIGPAAIVKAWNAMATAAGLPLVKTLTKSREKHIAARIKGCAGGAPDMLLAIERVSRSPFLTGRVPGKDGKDPFKADLDFIINPDNFAKLEEGKYDDRSPKTTGSATQPVSRLTDPDEQYREHVRRWLRTGTWPEGWGQSPLYPTKAQEKILAEDEFKDGVVAFRKRGGPERPGAPRPVLVDTSNDPALSPSEILSWRGAVTTLLQRGEWNTETFGPLPWALTTRCPPQIRREMRAEIATAKQTYGEGARAQA